MPLYPLTASTGDSGDFPLTLIVAISANFVLQVLTSSILARSRVSKNAVAIGLIAGNRNIALFLTALAVTTTQPILLFIACYQIPMYLTPIVMQRFYRSLRTKNPPETFDLCFIECRHSRHKTRLETNAAQM
jgi:hypothetical protein